MKKSYYNLFATILILAAFGLVAGTIYFVATGKISGLAAFCIIIAILWWTDILMCKLKK
jgi:hypothetical protein